MKAAVQRIQSPGIDRLVLAMAEGMQRHGLEIERYDGTRPPAKRDFVLTWGWRRALYAMKAGETGPFLIMERGYLGDRINTWTSAGWDGLNGRARFPKVDDASRFGRYFQLAPWKAGGDYALLVGQVKGDTALIGVDIEGWYRETARKLIESGWKVRFRQHPREIALGYPLTVVPGTERSTGTLEEDLAGAAMAVTYSSNTGTDAVMAGVPVHAEDEGSMVWPVASHDLSVTRPDRRAHMAGLAWCQWQYEELASGLAWDYVRRAM